MWAGEHIQGRTQDGSSLPGAGSGSIYHLNRKVYSVTFEGLHLLAGFFITFFLLKL